MQEKLQKIKDSFEKKLKSIKDLDSLDILYNEYFSRKAGEMTNIMKSLKDLSGEERKEMVRALCTYDDGKSKQRVLNAIENFLNEGRLHSV